MLYDAYIGLLLASFAHAQSLGLHGEGSNCYANRCSPVTALANLLLGIDRAAAFQHQSPNHLRRHRGDHPRSDALFVPRVASPAYLSNAMKAGSRWTPQQGGERHISSPRIRGRLMTAVFAAILMVSPAPGLADGFDDALQFCPDERITCVSSLDPAPNHFVEPWEYDGPLERAVDAVTREAARRGGQVVRDDSSSKGVALRVGFPKSDSAIFWFPVDDAVVQFRSERIDGSLWDFAANKIRIDEMRKALGYAPAPSVRNRRYLPNEKQADGTYKLEEERPYKRADGKLYGQQAPGDSTAGERSNEFSMKSGLFPFSGLDARGTPAQSLYYDLNDLAKLR